jgi:hypothetical protein
MVLIFLNLKVDGFAAARELKKRNPQAYESLTTTGVRGRIEDYETVDAYPIIKERNGQLEGLIELFIS